MSAQSIPTVEYRRIGLAYRVGFDGSVWTCWRKGPGARADGPWKLMRPTIDRDGYRRVELTDHEGKKITRKVCGLVLVAFVGERPDGQEARHLDGNPANDARTNLVWGTPLENHADKRRHGTIAAGERHGKVKLTADQIADVLSLKGLATQLSVADKFGVSRGYVGQIWSGNRSRVGIK